MVTDAVDGKLTRHAFERRALVTVELEVASKGIVERAVYNDAARLGECRNAKEAIDVPADARVVQLGRGGAHFTGHRRDEADGQLDLELVLIDTGWIVV